MKFIRKIVKYLGYSFLSILFYLIISILLSYITVNKQPIKNPTTFVYLSTNGIHLSLILPAEHLSKEVKQGIFLPTDSKFVSFGWGDENFYLNTPTWSDVKLKYAFGALFLNNSTLLEVSSYHFQLKKWVKVPVNSEQLHKLNEYITGAFKTDGDTQKILINQNMYPTSQLFKANGSYSPVKTCNTWVNTGFKKSGIKASYWTLFDFGLLNKYK